MDIEHDIQTLESQIAALTEELRPVQTEHDSLYKQLARFEADNKHKNLSKPPAPKRPILEHDDDVPPLIHYSCFDEAIQGYFHDQEQVGPETHPDTDLVLAAIDARARGSDHALHESIFRLSGVTAFPIDEHLYDARDDALLGLRFDLLCHTTLRFLKPHYIILRKRHSPSKSELSLSLSPWHIFRYTTPAYVPLDRLSLLLGDLDRFALEVSLYLVHTQYRHDKMDQVAALTLDNLDPPSLTQNLDHDGSNQDSGRPAGRIVTRLEKDLECRVVSLHLEHGIIELTCGLSLVDHVKCTLSPPNRAASIFISTALAGSDLTKFRSTFLSVVNYMRENRLL